MFVFLNGMAFLWFIKLKRCFDVIIINNKKIGFIFEKYLVKEKIGE